jgi:hypothetical protein
MADAASENRTPQSTHRDDYITPKEEDIFFANPAVDNVMSAVIALGSEFWALQRRMNVMETLLEENGSVSKDMIEAYAPTPEQHAAWNEQRDRFIRRVYSFLQNTDAPSDTTQNNTTSAG